MSNTVSVITSDVAGMVELEQEVSATSSIADFIRSTLPDMNLPGEDSEGNPTRYRARLEREGRYLHSSELVGEALQDRDSVVFAPEIQAGRR